jgi:hypothetical protein
MPASRGGYPSPVTQLGRLLVHRHAPDCVEDSDSQRPTTHRLRRRRPAREADRASGVVGAPPSRRRAEANRQTGAGQGGASDNGPSVFPERGSVAAMQRGAQGPSDGSAAANMRANGVPAVNVPAGSRAGIPPRAQLDRPFTSRDRGPEALWPNQQPPGVCRPGCQPGYIDACGVCDGPK